MKNEQEEQFEEEFTEGAPNVWRRVVRGVVALVVLVGMVYLFGLSRSFFFQRTYPDIEQEQLQTAVDAERLALPLTIFLVQSKEAHGSQRDRQDVARLVGQADRIWEQASIDLEIQNIHAVEKTAEEIEVLYENASVFAQGLEGFDADTVNVALVGSLQGLNGVSFGGIPLVAVADYTTVYDFRALAHEIGHKLGLGHVQDERRLMHQGANSFELSIEEIGRAREFTKQLR